MAEAVRQRIAALARAHELTLPNLAADADPARRAIHLDELLRTIVSPHTGNEEDRVSAHGPDVVIGGHAVTSFALLLHEMATNAAKYGALSTLKGRIAVDWRVVEDTLHLTWWEKEGPTVSGEPLNSGFGTALAEATIKNQFGGSISRDWRSGGLVVHLAVPLKRLTR
jgi:two-component sensor histidine kinase